MVGQLSEAPPHLLILNGRFAHVDFDTISWAIMRVVDLFVLPAYIFFFLQPLDPGVYQLFNRLYEGALEKFTLTTGFLSKKESIMNTTKLPFNKAYAPQKTRKAFEKAKYIRSF